MNETTSVNEKIDIMMSSNKPISKTLYYTYNKFMNYGVTPKLLEKRKDLCNKNTKFKEISDMFVLLDSLNYRMLTGHDAIKEINGFLFHNNDLKEILYLILERNLKIRVSSKLINKAIPGLIPEFNVALANKYNDKTKKKVDFKKDVWYVSRKLDGVRCLVVVDEKGKATSYSRAGKQFHTLSLVEKEIEKLGVKDVVFDGEMCIVNENGDEDFQSVMKEISRKNHTIQNGLFQVFDYIPYNMFSKGHGNTVTFSQRTLTLHRLLLDNKLNYIKFLEQIPVTSFEELDSLSNTAASKGWEGLMIRKSDIYKGKRTNDILKIKTFHDDEYKVEGLNFGPFRYVKEGKEVEEEMLTAVLIKHKGNTVNVGSGFTIEQRQAYFKQPSSIHGKIITVQYFEESQNQNGDYSLRFPVIKAIHGEKREV
tara:strand:- start:384 stop:1652 length:1269 start_codon:yes stop_codon:yes gene_type:complete